jgi:hypothetical protein
MQKMEKRKEKTHLGESLNVLREREREREREESLGHQQQAPNKNL